jgi:FKBP-type peptidyl-prolyl cis-trans isomerase
MKLAAIVLFGLVMACGGRDGRVPVVQRHQPSTEDMIQENRAAVKLEDRDINLYVERHGLSVTNTGRGVRYQLLRDVDGPTVQPGQWAFVHYRLELLNGDTAYASDPGSAEAFMVEMDDVESGLHEGIQLLSPGDSAVLIIPSYRAHGLIGDQDRIPPRSTVVYHIGLSKVSGKAR